MRKREEKMATSEKQPAMIRNGSGTFAPLGMPGGSVPLPGGAVVLDGSSHTHAAPPSIGGAPYE